MGSGRDGVSWRVSSLEGGWATLAGTGDPTVLPVTDRPTNRVPLWRHCYCWRVSAIIVAQRLVPEGI